MLIEKLYFSLKLYKYSKTFSPGQYKCSWIALMTVIWICLWEGPTHLIGIYGYTTSKSDVCCHKCIIAYRQQLYVYTNNYGRVQSDQINMVMFFWYLVKSDFSIVSYCKNSCTLDRPLFTRYQKQTAMLNWSPNRYIAPEKLVLAAKKYLFGHYFILMYRLEGTINP